MRPVHIDGAIYVAIAISGAGASALGSDDAAKYIEPATLWYVKNICTGIAAGLLALKMFRSEGYSRDQKEQQTGLTEAGDLVKVKVKTKHEDYIAVPLKPVSSRGQAADVPGAMPKS